MQQADLTVVILTFNEEKHIARCIDSVKNIAKDILVIDSYSTDDTVEIATKHGARVLQNPWVNHATQFNWGLSNGNIDTEWVFRLDADEYLESGHDELNGLIDLNEDITGVNIKRKYFFLGKWIKYGAMYPLWHLRIWRHAAGKIENRWMDEHAVLDYGATIDFNIDIVDDNKNDISWWMDKHNKYATLEMVESLNLQYGFSLDESLNNSSGSSQRSLKRFLKNKVYTKLPLFVRPIFYFLYRYFIRLGFLDGLKGFMYHLLQAFVYRVIVDCKMIEAKIWLAGEDDPEKVRQILADRTSLKI